MLSFAVAIALLVFGACGGGSDVASGSDDGDPPTSAPHLVTVDNKFEPTTIEAPAGETASVHVQNVGDNAHTFTIDELGVSVTVDPGQSETVEVEVPEKETEFRCEFHGTFGMTGTLVPE